MSKTEYLNALKNMFDNNLKSGEPYGKDYEEFYIQSDNEKLVYQDWTSCSATYACCDVFILDDKSYIVKCYTDSSMNYKNVKNYVVEGNRVIVPCKNLDEVFIVLMSFQLYDGNTSYYLYMNIIKKRNHIKHYKKLFKFYLEGNNDYPFYEFYKDNISNIINIMATIKWDKILLSASI